MNQNQQYQAEGIMANMTPFVYLDRTGWVPNLMPGMTIDFGTRFDAGIGYRVFFKYSQSEKINAFPALMAEWLAEKVKRMPQPIYKELAKNLVQAASECAKMNELWAKAGCPDEPIDSLGVPGHA